MRDLRRHDSRKVSNVLITYAVALPAYVATEVITRGLVALREL